MTKEMESADARARSSTKGLKRRQVVNNALACVKMNTVIGINDFMGD